MERNSQKRIRMFDKMKMSIRIRTRIMDLVIKRYMLHGKDWGSLKNHSVLIHAIKTQHTLVMMQHTCQEQPGYLCRKLKLKTFSTILDTPNYQEEKKSVKHLNNFSVPTCKRMKVFRKQDLSIPYSHLEEGNWQLVTICFARSRLFI